MLEALDRLMLLIERYPLRGLKGPVGTQQDLLDLVDGDAGAVDTLERSVADQLGFATTLGSVGQVYPRSLDFDVVSALVQLSSGPANLAKSIRLMAGADLVTEGFKEGQVGSSAMPHKMNSRSSERIGGFVTILGGHLTMASGLVGDQWNEGDVSDSVVRRVMLPDAFFAIDGLLETTMTVIEEFGVYPAIVNRELQRYLPFLSTTRLLIAAVHAGVGREAAHAAIKRHAVASARAMRSAEIDRSDLFERVAADPELPIDPDDIAVITGDPGSFTGRAAHQVERFVRQIEQLVARFPDAATYRPRPIL